MILTKMHLARLLAFLATRDAELGPASRPARCAHCGGPILSAPSTPRRSRLNGGAGAAAGAGAVSG